jgi:hypothetical protein
MLHGAAPGLRAEINEVRERAKAKATTPDPLDLNDTRVGLLRQIAGRADKLKQNPNTKIRQALEWARGFQHNLVEGATPRTIVAGLIFKLEELLDA